MAVSQLGVAGGDQAHRKVVEARFAEIVRYLQEVFGQKLVAYMANVKDPKTVGRWADDVNEPRLEAERRLREAYRVFQMLQSADSPHTTRAWFVGLNPQLGDDSPAQAIREDRLKEVVTAAKAFMAGG